MRQIALLVILILASFQASAGDDAAGNFFSLEGKYVCINYSGKLVIVQKVSSKDPKEYEVFARDPMTGQGRPHMILFTQKSNFTSEGLVHDDLWVKTTRNDGDETITIHTQAGFDKKVDVIRESSECEEKHLAALKSPEHIAEQKAAADEEKKVIEDFNAENAALARAKAEDKRIASLPVAEQQKIARDKQNEINAKSSKWDHMSGKEKAAMCKEKGIPLDGEQTYCMD